MFSSGPLRKGRRRRKRLATTVSGSGGSRRCGEAAATLAKMKENAFRSPKKGGRPRTGSLRKTLRATQKRFRLQDIDRKTARDSYLGSVGFSAKQVERRMRALINVRVGWRAGWLARYCIAPRVENESKHSTRASLDRSLF